MGFLERTGNDEDSDDNESADFVMTSQKSPTKSKKDEEVKSTTDAPSKTTTSKTVVKVKAKNFVVKKANKVKAKVKNTNKKVKKVVDENVQKRNIAFQRKRLSPALAAICGKRILSRQVLFIIKVHL
jgi:chromatin remodeling complex protein RSC6